MMDERQFRLCISCGRIAALVNHDFCGQCRSAKCIREDGSIQQHEDDPCTFCGYKRMYGQGDDISECYKESIHEIEQQAQFAAWDMRRALCRMDIAKYYGVQTEVLDIINEIIGCPGVEYKITKK